MDTLAILAGIDDEGGYPPSSSGFSAENFLQSPETIVGVLALIERTFSEADALTTQVNAFLTFIETHYGKDKCVQSSDNHCYSGTGIIESLLAACESKEIDASKIAFVSREMAITREIGTLYKNVYPGVKTLVAAYDVLRKKAIDGINCALSTPVGACNNGVIDLLMYWNTVMRHYILHAHSVLVYSDRVRSDS
ncbi:MAG: hypothetical protein ACKO0Z_03420 [Betaproteobacteria bacterium]